MPRNSSAFRPQTLRKLTARMGENVIWTPAQKCICRVNSADADPNCRVCHGYGQIWKDDRLQLLRAIVFSPSLEHQLVAPGTLETGELLMSQEPIYPQINLFDRIQLIKTYAGEPFEGETRPSDATSVTLSYVPTILEEVATGDSVSGVYTRFKHYYLDPFTAVSALPADADCYYTRNDYLLHWVTGRAPAVGTLISLRYTARFEYVAVAFPMQRFSRDTDLGNTVKLRLKHRLVSDMQNVPTPMPIPAVESEADRNDFTGWEQ